MPKGAWIKREFGGLVRRKILEKHKIDKNGFPSGSVVTIPESGRFPYRRK